jgi:hypothetical protein
MRVFRIELFRQTIEQKSSESSSGVQSRLLGMRNKIERMLDSN